MDHSPTDIAFLFLTTAFGVPAHSYSYLFATSSLPRMTESILHLHFQRHCYDSLLLAMSPSFVDTVIDRARC